MVLTIDAVSHNLNNWHAINWPTVNQTVSRIQARIVKAVQEGKWRKVRSLQRLLTRSFSGKALAIKRVTENRGKKTPGVDGEIWNTPVKKMAALLQLKQTRYKPLPLRRIYIPKGHDGKKRRPLSIPVMKCRAMQALYLLALDPIAETLLGKRSYGFRKERSTADAIEQCFTVLCRNCAPRWILEGDIRSCFDEISHEWLLKHLPMEKTILRKWLKVGFIERKSFHHTEMGTPQGGIISPTACNMVLTGLEEELITQFGGKHSSKGSKHKINFILYADDFIITGVSKELLENEVIPLVENFLETRGLRLSKEKTRITHIDDGFDFLGQNVRKYKGKLLIKPSQKSIQAHLKKIRTTIERNKQAKTENLIRLLNPVIRGWANYHRHVVSKETFTSIDHAIFQKLWQWAKRRHPKKPKRWIKDRYFMTHKQDQWRFFAKTVEGMMLRLEKAGEIAITRHTPIRGDANPYDPKDETYFDQRLTKKWLKGEKGRGKLRSLWLKQKGLCPICRQKLVDDPGWEIHHIIHRVDGGSDNLDNLVVLHPNCHKQVHNQGDLWQRRVLKKDLMRCPS